MPLASDSPALDREAHQGASNALLALLEERRASQEVALAELHHPGEPRLERRRALVDLVAIERHGRLEPQRVAGAEARRHQAVRRAGGEQAPPDLRRPFRLEVELEAVLARIAGPRQDRRHPGHLAAQEAVVAQAGDSGGGERLEEAEGPRPLRGEQREAVALVGDLYVRRLGALPVRPMLADPGQVARRVGG